MSDKKIFISLPMRGKEDKYITNTIDYATKLIENDGHYTVEPSRFNPEIIGIKAEARGSRCIPLYSLSQSLDLLSRCDAILMCPGWEDARGCRIEREAARAYGLDILTYAYFED